MDTLALGLGLALTLLLVKEMGVPIPVPGDLIVLGAGAAVARSNDPPVIALVAVIAATVAGGAVQFLLVRGAARPMVLGILRRVGVGESRIEAVADRLRRRGATGVAVARTTPGVRIVAVAAAGIAALPFPRFLAGLAAGNALFVGGHFALGFALGPAAEDLATRVGGIGLVVVGAIVVLGAIGWVGWRLIRRRASSHAVEVAGDWSDATCPACLVLGAVASRVARVDPAQLPVR